MVAFNLIEGIDVPAIEAKIAQYQEENAEQIMINRARKVTPNKISVAFPLLLLFLLFTLLILSIISGEALLENLFQGTNAGDINQIG